MKRSEAYKSYKRKENILLIVAVIIGLIFAAGINHVENTYGFLWGLLLFVVGVIVETEIIYYALLLEYKPNKKKFNTTDKKGESIFVAFVGMFMSLIVWFAISKLIIPHFQTVLSIIIAVMVGLLIAGLIIILIMSWFYFNKDLAIRILGKKRVK